MEQKTQIGEPLHVPDYYDPETEIHLKFNLADIEDVRHMIVKSGSINHTKEQQAHVLRVLDCIGEMITKGLHVRDIDEVDFMGDIEAFHQKFGLEYVGKPRVLDDDLFDFRNRFIAEEHNEWADEQPELLRALIPDEKSEVDHRRIAMGLEQQLDALVDLCYATLGAAYLQFGPKVFREAWRRVQAANMAKVRAERAEDSKRGSTFDVIKPAGWTPPDHHDLVKDHAHVIYQKGQEDANPNYKGDAIGTSQAAETNTYNGPPIQA